MTKVYCDRFSCVNCKKSSDYNNGECIKDEIQINYDSEENKIYCQDFRARSFKWTLQKSISSSVKTIRCKD